VVSLLHLLLCLALLNTFTGSLSPDQSLFEGSTSTDTAEHSSPEIDLKASPSATLNRLGSPKGATEHVLSPLGRLAVLSEASQTRDLDWALIRIDSPLPPSIRQSPKNNRTQSVARDLPGKAKIQVMTTTEYIIQGTITGCSTFMQLPYSVAFQEMWSVQLDGPLSEYWNPLKMILLFNCTRQNTAIVDLGLSTSKVGSFMDISLLEIHEPLSPI
jgi:hypothetical protein